MFFLFVIFRFTPCRDGFTVEDNDVEECIEEEDGVGLDRDGIEEGGLRWPVEGIRE